MSDIEGLEPCPNPWCASHKMDDFQPKLERSDRINRGYYVRCSPCGVSSPPRETEAEATAAWNTRAPDPSLQSKLAEAERALEKTAAAILTLHQFRQEAIGACGADYAAREATEKCFDKAFDARLSALATIREEEPLPKQGEE